MRKFCLNLKLHFVITMQFIYYAFFEPLKEAVEEIPIFLIIILGLISLILYHYSKLTFFYSSLYAFLGIWLIIVIFTIIAKIKPGAIEKWVDKEFD